MNKTVEVTKIQKVEPHPNADRLEVLTVKGKKTVAPKHYYKEGDMVLYIPVDAIIPESVARHWAVTRYLGRKGNVKVVKIKGVESYGFVDDVGPLIKDFSWPQIWSRKSKPAYTYSSTKLYMYWPKLGDNVADKYEIIFREPKVKKVDRKCDTSIVAILIIGDEIYKLTG